MTDTQLNLLIGYLQSGVPAIFQQLVSSFTIIVILFASVVVVGAGIFFVRTLFSVAGFRTNVYR